jgi:nitrogen regulatory protein PII-like uncharacterized protein
MKQDTDWNMASMSYNPLELYWLIEKMTLAQTEDQYPLATVYDQELGFYSFRQETMSNPQWYKKFNTKVDVGLAISITRQLKVLAVLLEYVAQENHTLTFAASSAEQCQLNKSKQSVRTLRSGTSHMPSYIRVEPNMVTSRWI